MGWWWRSVTLPAASVAEESCLTSTKCANLHALKGLSSTKWPSHRPIDHRDDREKNPKGTRLASTCVAIGRRGPRPLLPPAGGPLADCLGPLVGGGGGATALRWRSARGPADRAAPVCAEPSARELLRAPRRHCALRPAPQAAS